MTTTSDKDISLTLDEGGTSIDVVLQGNVPINVSVDSQELPTINLTSPESVAYNEVINEFTNALEEIL